MCLAKVIVQLFVQASMAPFFCGNDLVARLKNGHVFFFFEGVPHASACINCTVEMNKYMLIIQLNPPK